MIKNLILTGALGKLPIMEQRVKMHQRSLLQDLKLVQVDVFIKREYHEFMSRPVLNIVVIHDMLVPGSELKKMVKFVGIS
jgi:hypothetical protein